MLRWFCFCRFVIQVSKKALMGSAIGIFVIVPRLRSLSLVESLPCWATSIVVRYLSLHSSQDSLPLVNSVGSRSVSLDACFFGSRVCTIHLFTPFQSGLVVCIPSHLLCRHFLCTPLVPNQSFSLFTSFSVLCKVCRASLSDDFNPFLGMAVTTHNCLARCHE